MPNAAPTSFDWQGHRGARGLLPENTIPSFLRALSYPEVVTLELDVVIAADDRVIVSHDPFMEAEICLTPAGEEITEVISLRKLTTDEIAAYDCGTRPHPRFPEQARRPARKPTLAAVFAAVDRYCVQQQRPSPRYNIELKYQSDWEPELVPDRKTLVDLVVADVLAWGKPELVNLQCFDPPTLAIIHEGYPGIQLAYLDEDPGVVKRKMSKLGFVPVTYSPWEARLTRSIVAEAHSLGMRVVPWTVNEVPRMRELREMGVDGIITDYPNRIAAALKKTR
ncbi:glycerophosphoryl diester phosphodiesterase [Lewinella aquimaris]|uniref:Glycerophosphoryl diester phosphodiesterase n=1 Tax=Neolewinella aquimaris TaxID=1835722 RepID=A0A840DY33_9BACT|nr:glycerophosphodiester phosphodiesterase family protein [Neolewinella aquimaris]MBB4078134.1 glycerophosphoryl diester phosphodiesterase [Neolewinella aquimaris]